MIPMLPPAERLKIISHVKATVLRYHFNSCHVNYADWSKIVEEQRLFLLMGDDDEFENGVRKLLSELKSSHTNFYRSDSRATLPQHAIGATFRSEPYQTAQRWMVLDVFEGSPAVRAGLKPGQFLVTLDTAPVSPPLFPVFGFGQQHRLTIETLGQSRLTDAILFVPSTKRKSGRPPLVEPRCLNHWMLGNIGILKIPFFPGVFGIQFSRLLDRVIDSLKAQGCDRLIIDLRGCLGGSLGFARLASYLCPDRTPIGYDLSRRRLEKGYDVAQLPRVPMPSSMLQLLFSLARFSLRDKSLMLLTQGLGKQPFHGRVVVLINEWTNSAGEMIAQFAKETKAATLIGKRTRGNVLGSRAFRVGRGYWLYLPVFGWFSPSGNCAEGLGVPPDVEVDINPHRLAFGHDCQLTKAIEHLR
jgi:C-terminal processing protease CtpA/Prc